MEGEPFLETILGRLVQTRIQTRNNHLTELRGVTAPVFRADSLSRDAAIGINLGNFDLLTRPLSIHIVFCATKTLLPVILTAHDSCIAGVTAFGDLPRIHARFDRTLWLAEVKAF